MMTLIISRFLLCPNCFLAFSVRKTDRTFAVESIISHSFPSSQKFNISNGMAGISSLPMPCPKETLSRVAVPRNSSKKHCC